MSSSVRATLAALLFSACLTSPVFAQQTGNINGTVETARKRAPAVGVNVIVIGTLYAAITDSAGAFQLVDLPPGSYTVQVEALGYRPAQEVVQVSAGEAAAVRFRLRTEEVELEDVQMMALQADLQPVVGIDSQAIRRRNALATGLLLRDMAGVEAGRTSVLSFDPNVRGLSARQLGVFVDGVRLSSTNPFSADPTFRYIDPASVTSIKIVKGPYALTWGAGMQSLIWVQTLIATSPDARLRGAVEAGYRSNVGVWETAGSAGGTVGNIEYGLYGAYRTGDDYESGGDERVDADFKASDVGGRLSYRLSSAERLTVAAGYHRIADLDLPLAIFENGEQEGYHGMIGYQIAPATGLVRGIDFFAFGERLQQDLTIVEVERLLNDPQPLTNLQATDFGGRLGLQLTPVRRTTVEIGGDVRTHHREALAIFDGITQEDVLPDTRITEVGAFLHASRPLGRVEASAATRLDVVKADAGRAPRSFLRAPFLLYAASDLRDTETNLSAAFTLAFSASPIWLVSAGVGSVVRTADAVERYSAPFDILAFGPVRFPNPSIRPERSTQVDLWLTGDYPRLAARFHIFGRRVHDYIAVAPFSPPFFIYPAPLTSFANHDATFYGAEALTAYALFGEYATLNMGLNYLWGQDTTADQPVFAVMPLTGHLGVRFEAPANLFFFETTVRTAAKQDRVAMGELATDGYLTADLRLGVRLPRAASLVVGFDNLTNTDYVHHLSRFDNIVGSNFTTEASIQARLPEPGRVFFIKVRKAF